MGVREGEMTFQFSFRKRVPFRALFFTGGCRRCINSFLFCLAFFCGYIVSLIVLNLCLRSVHEFGCVWMTESSLSIMDLV